MTTQQINNEIIRIRKIEKQAKEIKNRLWRLEVKWKNQYDKVAQTPQWIDSCKAVGYSPDYIFDDILA